MNPFGPEVRRLLERQGFRFGGGGFAKLLQQYELLFELAFSPVKDLAGILVGYSISMWVSYPLDNRFFAVSPAELLNLRRDGTLRTVSFASEEGGIFSKAERAEVLSLLDERLGYWEDKLASPENCLRILDAFRGAAPIPEFMGYMKEFVALNEADKLQLIRKQTAFVYIADDLRNLLSRAAYMNVAGRFDDAVHELERRPLPLNAPLRKVHADAAGSKIKFSERNLDYLRKRGLI